MNVTRYSAGFSLSLASIVMLFSAGTSPAQRLCEHNDNPVAKIAPCTGPTGTAITVTMIRSSVPPASALSFRRTVSNAAPAAVSIPVANGVATSNTQLCINGPGRWEVWLIDGSGTSQGKIGAFWPDCSGGPVPPPNPNAGAGAQPGPNAKFDKCLVGKWENVAGVAGQFTGGIGMVITIKADGTQTVDYSSMQPLVLAPLSYHYAGVSVGQLTTKNNTAKSKGISNNTTLEIRMNGSPGQPKSSIGPMLGINKNSNTYSCTTKTLEFSQEDFKGAPWLKITMKRK